MKRRIALFALLFLGAAPVIAEENDSGFYLGAGIGQATVKIDTFEQLENAVEGLDDEDTSWKIFAGWRFMPFLAVELTYLDLGKAEDTIGPIPVSAEIDGFAPYLVGTLPLGPVELFARVGYYFYDVKVNEESLNVRDESDEDFTYGAGIGVTLFDHLHARLEYEVIDVSDKIDDANAIWLSGAWRF